MPIDMSLAATKAPPRKRAATPASKAETSSKPDTRTVTEKRAEGLLGIGQLLQGVCVLTGQFADAAAIGRHFSPVAVELAKCADSSDIIAKPVDFLIEVGPYGALISAVMPLAFQIAANHGWIDASRMMSQGVVPPAVLEAQMNAEIARVQAEAMAQQKAAIAEAQRVQREYQEMMAEAA
jgi:hypothetical protein